GGGGGGGEEEVGAGGEGGAEERSEPDGGEAEVSDEAGAAEREGGLEVAPLHRAAERGDRVLDEAGLEDELVDRAGRPQLVGEHAGTRQHHGAVHARRIEVAKDRQEAPRRTAVPDGIVHAE